MDFELPGYQDITLEQREAMNNVLRGYEGAENARRTIAGMGEATSQFEAIDAFCGGFEGDDVNGFKARMHDIDEFLKVVKPEERKQPSFSNWLNALAGSEHEKREPVTVGKRVDTLLKAHDIKADPEGVGRVYDAFFTEGNKTGVTVEDLADFLQWAKGQFERYSSLSMTEQLRNGEKWRGTSVLDQLFR